MVLFEYLHEDFRLLPDAAGAVAGLLAAKQLRPPLPELVAAAAGTAPFPLPREDRAGQPVLRLRLRASSERPTLPAVALQRHALPALARLGARCCAAGGPAGGQRRSGRGPARCGRAERAGRRDARAAARPSSPIPALGARLRARLDEAALDAATRRLLAALIALYDGPDSRYLDFYGPAGRVRTMPLRRLLADAGGGAPLPDLAGQVVFVGQSELINASEDGFATVFPGPKGARISGVEIAATAFANLLEGRLLEPAGLALTLVWIGGFGLVVSLIARLLPALLAVPLALAFAGACYLGAQLRSRAPACGCR